MTPWLLLFVACPSPGSGPGDAPADDTGLHAGDGGLTSDGGSATDGGGEGRIDADGDGWAAGEDCDDADASVHPDADEICDGVDQDCDGTVDEDATDARSGFPDDDGDGFGDEARWTVTCEATPALIEDGTDCDDGDASVNPSTEEVCGDFVDQDCDGRSGSCALTGHLTTSDADLAIFGTGWKSLIGQSMLLVPDVDGDGADELVLGAGGDSEQGYCGQLLVFFGGPSGELTEDDFDMRIGCEDSLGIGGYLSWGDFDADGVAEAVTGMTDALDGGWGAVGFVDISRSGDTDLGDVVTQVTSTEYYFGPGVAFPWRDAEGVDEGDILVAFSTISESCGLGESDQCVAVQLYMPPVEHQDWESYDSRLLADHVWAHLRGSTTATIGDTDGDGYASFAITAWTFSGEGQMAGVLVLDIPPEGEVSLSNADSIVWSPDKDHSFTSVLPSGDVDGDGYADLLIGDASGSRAEAPRCGAVRVLPGPLDADQSSDDASFVVYGPSSHFGMFYGSAGDIDGNGVDDLVVSGGYSHDEFPGSAFVYYGPLTAGTWTHADADLWVENENELTLLPASGGDFDGDGRGDFVLGAPYDSINDANSGAAYLFFGKGI